MRRLGGSSASLHLMQQLRASVPSRFPPRMVAPAAVPHGAPVWWAPSDLATRRWTGSVEAGILAAADKPASASRLHGIITPLRSPNASDLDATNLRDAAGGSGGADPLVWIELCTDVEQLAAVWMRPLTDMEEAHLVLTWRALARMAGGPAAEPRGVYQSLMAKVSRRTLVLAPHISPAGLPEILGRLAALFHARLHRTVLEALHARAVACVADLALQDLWRIQAALLRVKVVAAPELLAPLDFWEQDVSNLVLSLRRINVAAGQEMLDDMAAHVRRAGEEGRVLSARDVANILVGFARVMVAMDESHEREWGSSDRATAHPPADVIASMLARVSTSAAELRGKEIAHLVFALSAKQIVGGPERGVGGEVREAVEARALVVA
ncbi:hypothetical protein T484DRAFT_1827393, partial [Baffinella frigidus]